MGMSAWAHTPFISGIAHLSDAGLDQTGSFVWFWLYMYMYMYIMYMYMYMYTLYMLHVVSFGFGFIEPATSPKGLLVWPPPPPLWLVRSPSRRRRTLAIATSVG